MRINYLDSKIKQRAVSSVFLVLVTELVVNWYLFKGNQLPFIQYDETRLKPATCALCQEQRASALILVYFLQPVNSKLNSNDPFLDFSEAKVFIDW